MTTSTLAPPALSPPSCRCANCPSFEGDPRQRMLCGRCYSDARTRGCFTTDGTRIATPPPPPTDVLLTDDDEQTPAEPVPITPAPRERRCRLDPLQQQQQNQADDADLLKAVDFLIGAGHYTTPDGIRGAGLYGAGRRAALSPPRTEMAAARLIEAGVLIRLTTRYCPSPGKKCRGRVAASVRRPDRPEGEQSP